MKRLILVLLLLLAATTARAGWLEYSPGFFINGTLSANDGYAYTRVHDCYGYHYALYSVLPQSQTYNSSNTTISYSRNWKTDLVQALSANKDSELFLQAIAESGLKANIQPGFASYGASYGGAYSANGVTSIAQGFAQSGSSIYGLAAIPAYGRLDTTAATHELQRTTDGLVQGAVQVNNLIASNIHEAAQSDSQVATILAIGQAAKANAEAAATIARSAQQPKQIRQEWQINPQRQQLQAQPPGDPQPDNRPAPPQDAEQPQAQPHQSVIPRIRGELTFQTNCLNCHSPGSGIKARDFSNLDRWSQVDRYELAKHARARMKGLEKPAMPKDHPALADLDIDDVTLHIAGPG